MVWVRERLGAERVCERRACQVLGQARSTAGPQLSRRRRANENVGKAQCSRSYTFSLTP